MKADASSMDATHTGYVRTVILAVMAVLVLHASAAWAGTLVYDAFNYPVNSNLNGQNGGSGWSGPWNATTDYTIGAGFLPIPGLASTGNHVSFTENNLATSEATRSLLYSGFGNDGTTTWVSFVMRADTNPTTGVFEFSVPNFFVGKVGVTDPNLWAVSRGGNTTQFSAVPILQGVPVFVVIEFQFNSDPSGNDLATVFFNPTPGQASPNVPGIAVSENFPSAVGNIFLDGANGTAFSFDPLVFGNTYGDVAPGIPGSPVPEPGTVVLLGTGLVGSAGAMRRRLLGR